MTREEAEKHIKSEMCNACSVHLGGGKCSDNCKVIEAIKALEQEPCEDVISRQAVIDSLHNKFADGFDSDRWWNSMSVLYAINKVPSVTPQPKTGHWIEKEGYDGDTYYDCPECGNSWTTIDGTPWDNDMKYCPNCGCRMIEPQGDEKTETWNGIHAQITAPKGTFERIFNDAADNNDSDI